jgi:hypothetical protein
LVIGYSADTLSILAKSEAYNTDDPVFELLDHLRDITYWVRDVPSPKQAQKLLDKHGKPPQEWDE